MTSTYMQIEFNYTEDDQSNFISVLNKKNTILLIW